MHLDYIFIFSVMLVGSVIGSVIGLVTYHAVQERHPRTKRNRDYQEVQAMVDKRVKWAAVAASILGFVGLAACLAGA